MIKSLGDRFFVSDGQGIHSGKAGFEVDIDPDLLITGTSNYEITLAPSPRQAMGLITPGILTATEAALPPEQKALALIGVASETQHYGAAGHGDPTWPLMSVSLNLS